MTLESLYKYKELFQEYTELRIQKTSTVSISLLKGDIVSNRSNTASGACCRVCKDGMWGFSSTAETDDENITRIIEEATENALFLSSQEKSRKRELPGTPVMDSRDYGTKKTRVSQKDKIDFLKEIDNYIMTNCPGLSSRTVTMFSIDLEKTLLTSEGSESYRNLPRTNFYFQLTMDKEGKPVEITGITGGRGHFEEFESSRETIFKSIDQHYSMLLEKMDAVDAEAGIKDVILHSDLAGVLAHEAMGHTTEADFVLEGSVAKDYLHKKVASDLISITDFAHTFQGEECLIPIHVDDEGNKAEDVVIIEKGILKNYMHNKETAALMNQKPKGNARAFNYSDEPLIRMRNTAILPGKDKLEDMIRSIKDGYFLVKRGNGQADSTGEFMFSVPMGYEIKEGKLGKAINEITISGIAMDVLKSVTMVSDEMSWRTAGFCGKRQPMVLSMGGPAIKCKVNIGGK